MDQIRISEKQLRDLSEEIFLGFGVSEEQTKVVVDVLINSELNGNSSHGVIKIIDSYLPLIKNKTIDIKSQPKVIQDDHLFTQLDAKSSFGHYASYVAMNHAINKANKYSASISSVRNSTHFGCAGYYSQMAAEQGLVGITLTNGSPAVSPPGGKNPIFGTNAISLSFPDYEGNKKPILIDLALSSTSLGSLLEKSIKGHLVPAAFGSEYLQQKKGVDKEQLINPLEILEERMISSIGSSDLNPYKGVVLSLMIEICLGLIFGGSFSFNHLSGEADHLFISINPVNFSNKEKLIDKFNELLNTIKNLEMIEGYEKFRIPGYKYNEIQANYKKRGIPILKGTWMELKGIVEQLPEKPNLMMEEKNEFS